MENENTKRHATLSEQLLDSIREKIANGTFDINTQLPTELELAKHFNVSRSSVREAMKTLSYLGIIESCPSRGTRVTNKNRMFEKLAEWTVVLGCDDYRDAFVLGTALDTQVTIIATEKLHHDAKKHKDFSDKIVNLLTKMAAAAISNDLPSFHSSFVDFFQAFYGFSQNNIFVALNECINNLIAERVCRAYYNNNSMLNVVQFFNSAWNAIRNYSKEEAIIVFQDYGAFAYDAVLKDEAESDGDAGEINEGSGS